MLSGMSFSIGMLFPPDQVTAHLLAQDTLHVGRDVRNRPLFKNEEGRQ